MMNGHGKSDSSAVPAKSPNQAEGTAAEAIEGRGLAKGNSPERNALRTQGRESTPSALERVREVARRDRKQRFTALLHHIYDVKRLRAAYLAIKRNAAAGVDGQTWEHYGETLEANLQDLSQRLKRGAYRARPVRRVYIPKVGKPGELRPLGVPALEDKIVQRATVEVLNAIYEQDFLGFSYGFRPGRSPHQALDALAVGIGTRKVNWVLDADIRRFYDTLDHGWMVRFVEHRVADRRVVRLIQKWLSAGVLEEGQRVQSEVGTVQGGSISPLLSNIYLHYVLDLWIQRWRQKQAHGEVIVVRFADDFVAGFQHRHEAERFLAELRERFAKFGLELHADKTRIVEFGRYAEQNRRNRGDGKPETFNFLGFSVLQKHTDKEFVVN
jgi:RNA-directed DNA polymerase